MIRYLLPLLFLLVACKEELPVPDPVPITADALSHYCQMQVIEHSGPKAQIHLEGLPDPLFFAQVRDALAYLKSAERSHRVLAAYFSDMGTAPSWEEAGQADWVEKENAVFVVGSGVKGGMGAPEIVPFGSEEDALAFVARHGGELMSFDAMPAELVLAPVEIELPEG